MNNGFTIENLASKIKKEFNIDLLQKIIHETIFQYNFYIRGDEAFIFSKIDNKEFYLEEGFCKPYENRFLYGDDSIIVKMNKNYEITKIKMVKNNENLKNKLIINVQENKINGCCKIYFNDLKFENEYLNGILKYNDGIFPKELYFNIPTPLVNAAKNNISTK